MLSIRYILSLFFSLSSPLLAISSSPWGNYKSANEEETLFLRRIADFWEEGEYGIAKKQIEEFLQGFPLSSFAEPLSIAMGDLFLREKDYKAALDYYTKIHSTDFLDKIFINRMQCLYYLEWFATLADECEARLKEPIDSELSLKITYYLAISLYHQCIHAGKNVDLAEQVARRAKPYFERLLSTQFSDEIALGSAHLCCILKDFPKATEIYLNLAEKEPSKKEEMFFQAALVQAEFAPSQALETFKKITQEGGQKAKEAAYNQMVLLFDSGQYEELLMAKDSFLKMMPQEKRGMAHLFLGKSSLALKKYSEAASELKNLVEESPSMRSENLQSAFLSLVEASFQSNDLGGMNAALAKLTELNPSHPEIAKGNFSRAMLFKKLGNKEECRNELQHLQSESSQFSLRPQVIFELAHLEYQEENWESCRSYSQIFVTEFPHSELAPFAWRYLASSSASFAVEHPDNRDLKGQLISDLKGLLEQENMFSQIERNDWQFFLAKAYFDQGYFKEAVSCLSFLLNHCDPFPHKANAYLLLAISYRNGLEDLNSFCSFAEQAIDQGATLMEEGALHLALFNAYLTRMEKEPSLIEKAAAHLYLAFEHKASIAEENLMWLAAYYEGKKDLDLIAKASIIYNHILASCPQNEGVIYQLAKLYSFLGKSEAQIALLNELLENNPSSEYKLEAQFLLAESYAAIGNQAMAASLYDFVAQTAPPIRSETSAKAHLQKALLKTKEILKHQLDLNHPETMETLTLLKDLILQKALPNEPVHLEAAFEYAHLKELLDPQPPQQRIAFLKKLKKDLESTDDILSKDYHQAKERFPEKEKIYLGYIQLLDAEILLYEARNSADVNQQKELQAKSKDLLLEIIRQQAHPKLIGRANLRLQAANVDFTAD